MRRGFTPHDPTEDTESVRGQVFEWDSSHGFTPHDPTEDTESSSIELCEGKIVKVSPLTIRQRILKVKPPGAISSHVLRGFTPHDPTEDTERGVATAKLITLHSFHPSRSDRGY